MGGGGGGGGGGGRRCSVPFSHYSRTCLQPSILSITDKFPAAVGQCCSGIWIPAGRPLDSGGGRLPGSFHKICGRRTRGRHHHLQKRRCNSGPPRYFLASSSIVTPADSNCLHILPRGMLSQNTIFSHHAPVPFIFVWQCVYRGPDRKNLYPAACWLMAHENSGRTDSNTAW